MLAAAGIAPADEIAAGPGAAPTADAPLPFAASASGTPGPSGTTPEVPDAPPPPSGRGLRAVAIPLVAYSSDLGWRAAGGVFLYDLGPRNQRDDWAAIQLSWTSRGPRYAELKGELRDLFGTSLRSFYQLKLLDDVAAPYWGEGANLGSGPAPGTGTPPGPFQYHVTGPWLAWSLRGPLSEHLDWFTRVRWTRRNLHDRGEVLEEERPVGYGGGGLALAAVGLVVDTRDDEIGPKRGVFADGSLLASPRLGRFSRHALAGANITVREYVPLWKNATLALRQLYENKVGDVPFGERTQLEGLGNGEGLGGAGTVRGMARARLSGEEKMLASVELRAEVLETTWWGRVQHFGLSAGIDAGRARQRGYEPVGGIGAFGGLRFAWDRAVLVRFEIGHAGQGGPAYYLSFDEPF